MGADVSPEKFVVAIKEDNAQFIGADIYALDGTSAARKAKEAIGA